MPATATPSDVKIESGSGGVIATSLSDSAVQSYIDDAYFEINRALDDYEAQYSDEFRTQIEKYHASLLIRKLADKPVQDTSRESASVSFEEGATSVGELQRKVDSLDPTNSLAYNVDNSRFVSSTDQSEN